MVPIIDESYSRFDILLHEGNRDPSTTMTMISRSTKSLTVLFRFFVLDKIIEELGFVFKGNLSNKQLKHPNLPKGILMDDDNDDDEDNDDTTEDNAANNADADAGIDADDDPGADAADIIDLTVESEDERVLKIAG